MSLHDSCDTSARINQLIPVTNKTRSRFSVPAADSFMMGIMDDEMDMDMAQSKEDKDIAIQSKASKTWRILRLSSRNKLAAFDKIDDGKNLKVLFETPSPAEGTSPPPQSSEKAAPPASAPTQPVSTTESQAPPASDEITTTEQQPEESGIGASEQGHESGSSTDNIVEKGDMAVPVPVTEQPSVESQQPPEAPVTSTTTNESS